MPKTTQRERVLRYLQEVGPITSGKAMDELGCFRLASRISELRQAEHPIKDRWIKRTNRWGDPVQFKEYFLPIEAQGTLL
jgi:hypothetical protein